MFDVFREYRFEAAHRLTGVPPDHKCGRLHGHSFVVRLHVRGGSIDREKGWLVDYAEIDQAFAPVFEQLDHHYLNDVAGLSNPTSEHIAMWIWERVRPALPQLARVVVQETCDAGCAYGPA